MLEYIQRLAWDPTAPVPVGWPHGWYGVLLLFCIPGGIGIPPGVLLGHSAGIGFVPMTVLYFISDVVLAFAFEPMLIVLAALARVVPHVERAGQVVMLQIDRMIGRFAGPTGIMLTSFVAVLPFGRALSAALGYALVGGWLLAIAGDMVSFAIGTASTLWFEGMFGNQLLAVLAGLVVMGFAPLFVRRFRRQIG